MSNDSQAPEVILSKCITLLFRESQVDHPTENSADLVRTVVDKIKISDQSVGIPTKRTAAYALKNLVLEMCRAPATTTYEASDLLQQIRIVTHNDETIYQAIEDAIKPELAGPILKRTITNSRKVLSNFFRECRQVEIVAKAHRDLSFGRHNITDLTQYVRNLISELEVTSAKAGTKEASVIKTLDLGDDSSMREVFDDVLLSSSEDLSYKTGWRELNDALQGGPRPGDMMVVGALQHNYKTGGSLSMFAHIAVYNRPKTKDPAKKPLLYRITMEDPLRNNAQFLYQLLKYDETKQPVDVKKVPVEEMISYVKRRLQVNGFHVLIDEVNPLNWTFETLVNRVVQLESMGYKVEVLALDYLSKMPTTGCTQGSSGDDLLDLFSRTRAFCAANSILFITPHQLSTEAKRLLSSIPTESFLTAIKGGGYFEKTKGLDRIYDIGVLIHKVEAQSGDYLHMVVDKHRFPTVVDASMKSFYLPFPSNKMPIPANLDDPYVKPLRKIPRGVGRENDSFFD